jgi:hypothetical protein
VLWHNTENGLIFILDLIESEQSQFLDTLHKHQINPTLGALCARYKKDCSEYKGIHKQKKLLRHRCAILIRATYPLSLDGNSSKKNPNLINIQCKI